MVVKINFYGGKINFKRSMLFGGNPQLPEAAIDWAIRDGRVALE